MLEILHDFELFIIGINYFKMMNGLLFVLKLLASSLVGIDLTGIRSFGNTKEWRGKRFKCGTQQSQF